MLNYFSGVQKSLIRRLRLLLIPGCFLYSTPTLAAQVYNAEAVIPPQCYTKTDGRFNPCYICHQSHTPGTRTNVMNDGGIQGEYSFSTEGETNHWTNLFHSRQADIEAIADNEILAYVRQDNYSTLLTAPDSGYQPDLANLADPERAFDHQGLALDGSGWVAFNYKPLPSTFWPTNGSYDDVIIRLPDVFRTTTNGNPSRELYFLNLSLVEMAIKDLDSISIPATNEQVIELDLDGDHTLGQATRLIRREYYLGAAEAIPLVRQQYPAGTEFLHTVRYLNVVNGEIKPARRMKELRYSRKYKQINNAALQFFYNQEYREKADARLPRYSWAAPAEQAGMNNKIGWMVQGWIESADGQLRLQNYEENFFCMGCHTTVGTTIDSTFAFPRKVTGASGWGYINLKGMPDAPNYGEQTGEIATYLQRVGGGDEFRQNREMLARWFDTNGNIDTSKISHADVYSLISPSPERALALNKAYRLIVAEQSFYLGRDAVLGQPVNIFDQVTQDSVPLLPADKQFHYDLRLQWPDREPEVVASDNKSPASPAHNAADTPAPADHEAAPSRGGVLAAGSLLVFFFLAWLLRFWRTGPESRS